MDARPNDGDEGDDTNDDRWKVMVVMIIMMVMMMLMMVTVLALNNYKCFCRYVPFVFAANVPSMRVRNDSKQCPTARLWTEQCREMVRKGPDLDYRIRT